jgi:hypothetical protein
MLRKMLRKELVCWPDPVPHGAIADAKIIEAGYTVTLRDNNDRPRTVRVAIKVGDEVMFCDRNQFWDAAR